MHETNEGAEGEPGWDADTPWDSPEDEDDWDASGEPVEQQSCPKT